MRAEARRKEIAAFLHAQTEPVSGGALAERFGVSRQIIVQDISLIKAQGYDILSTHNGYLLRASDEVTRIFKLHHSTEQTEDELMSIVNAGGTVVDVFVWHKVYGKVEAKLNIFSPLQVKQFLEGVRSGKSSELMNITGGYHYHTVRAESEAVLNKIEQMLQEKGYLAPGI